MYRVLLLALLAGCSSLKKDNEPKKPVTIHEEVKEKQGIYLPLIHEQLDGYGLAAQGNSVGDSALFSCLARAAGAANFNPAILWRDGRPVRHPTVAPVPDKSTTPVSRDMVAGALWCLYDLGHRGQKDHALELVGQMIEYGKAHPGPVTAGWMFCSEEERSDYHMTEEDWLGKCYMTPSIVKDIYRVATWLGVPCDDECQKYMTLGANIPSFNAGFQRHLAVITTVRNGLVEGGINDNSLRIVLESSASEQPRNSLYSAAYHTFSDGVQEETYKSLLDESLFPAKSLPSKSNYCAEYLFQRDEDGSDWAPCPDDPKDDRGRGIEWAFAAALALGDLQ